MIIRAKATQSASDNKKPRNTHYRVRSASVRHLLLQRKKQKLNCYSMPEMLCYLVPLNKNRALDQPASYSIAS